MKKLLRNSCILFAFTVFLSFNLHAQLTTQSGPINAPTQQQIHVLTSDLPVSIVYRVLYQAQVPLNTPFQVLLSEYYNKNCKVTCISIQQNGDWTFLVEYGGGHVILSLEDDI